MQLSWLWYLCLIICVEHTWYIFELRSRPLLIFLIISLNGSEVLLSLLCIFSFMIFTAAPSPYKSRSTFLIDRWWKRVVLFWRTAHFIQRCINTIVIESALGSKYTHIMRLRKLIAPIDVIFDLKMLFSELISWLPWWYSNPYHVLSTSGHTSFQEKLFIALSFLRSCEPRDGMKYS